MLLLLHANMKSEKLPHLRTILFAGEVFPMKYLRQLAELLPSIDLYNLYGPTETNVCTYYRVERERLSGMDKLPIGIACVRLGDRGRFMPVLVAGWLTVLTGMLLFAVIVYRSFGRAPARSTTASDSSSTAGSASL